MMKTAKAIIVADAVLALVFIACELPGVTGVSVHEWLGIVLSIALLAHAGKRVLITVKNARGVARAASQDSDKSAGGASVSNSATAGASASAVESAKAGNAVGVARLIVDAVALMTLAVCVVSGMMISGSVLPFFGCYATGYYFWSPLHAATATLLLSVLLVHAALNAGRVKSFLSEKADGAKAMATVTDKAKYANEQVKRAEESRGEGFAHE